jgi:DNA polymerase (family 10)
VRDLEMVLVADVAPGELFKRLSQHPGVHEFAGQDERRLTLRFAGGASAQIIVTTPVNVGAVLVQATGSEQHVAQLAAHASVRGLALTGAALWRGSEFVYTPDEESLYRALGLAYIEPELREGRGEIAAAERGELPRLVTRGDLRGFLHCHTSYSDGSNSVEDLALACRTAGYQWIGITDHSQAAAYAGGLKSDDLLRQGDEIDEVNARLQGIRVLKGVEADILADGRVDFEDRVLERLDFVIASIHSRFNMTDADMTARLLTAMDNPYLTIVGHPTGRLLLSRDPYGLDLDLIIEKAAEKGVALEVNADPHRLDLDWRVLPRVREGGVMVSIGADAHSVAGIGHVDYGVGIARKGWLGPTDILNTRSAEEFTAWAGRRRS